MFGAGSVGCQLGGLLAEFADVTLIGRPAAMDTLGREGLTLTGGPRGRPGWRPARCARPPRRRRRRAPTTYWSP
ncbi:2-dehydropantoate 2-reductase N-terminal domain-containing protein [Streptomyces sp. M19]